VYVDVFPVEGKIFQWREQKHTIGLKNNKNILFFSKKVKKQNILPGQGESTSPHLPFPTDALPCSEVN
jgi:hypothetical protein